ncbi:O-methyltransferase [Pochonia chlamydosporia 170]|uniref:O-methyltransferase n=1 Tax=Pochonia chlamydosporia 170 TaxID=1380566 RepID=A0A179FJN5_METCM|nr:O-methyltransferase [Pochonia chlamydosporia 170]OAQ65233.1 O-methyltransferase [Pochonia chlamydosporia 170]
MSNAYASPSEILALVQGVNEAAASFETSATSQGDLRLTRRRLQHEVQKLLSSLEEPNGEVWTRTFQVNVSAALEIVSQLELWDKFQGGNEVSIAEIVALTGADEIIIIRLFRQLTAAHLFVETTGPKGPSFVITSLGKPYLHPDHRAFNNFMFFDLIPSIMAMPKTLAERQYKAPTKLTGTPFQWAHGEELWTWLGSHPDRALNMVAAMTSHNPLDAYPWGTELAKLDLQDNDVAIVDVAGGQGHIMAEIRRRNPQIKGRFIVQDLPSTLDAVPTPPTGVELMGYDIFTPQSVKGAYFYHYRHIFHNWSDDDCTTILEQIVPLLRTQPQSKLLLVDMVLPDSNGTMQEAVMDISMFPMGGMERTESQWKLLLARSGLEIGNIWRGSEPEACIECKLL